MKKFQLFSLLLLMMAVMMPQTASAEYYGIKVGGVSVTSDNCDNISGDDIKPSNSFQDYWVRYDPNTKTLTMHNIWIRRTGSNNRAILNESCDGLTIVFEESNNLSAKDASPVRLNANTTITSASGMYGFEQIIRGGEEDALTVGNGAKLYINDINLRVKADWWSDRASKLCGLGIVGDTLFEELSLANAHVFCMGTGGIVHFLKLSITTCALDIYGPTYECAFWDIKDLVMNGSMIIKSHWDDEAPDVIYYDPDKNTFWDSVRDISPSHVRIATYIPINSTKFPDENLRNYIVERYDLNNDSRLDFFEMSEGIVIDISDKNIASVQGLEHFRFMESLVCSNNNLTKLNLSQFTELQHLDCWKNQITRIDIPNDSKLVSLDCSSNQITFLNFSNCPSIREINISRNNIYGTLMTETLESLPSITEGWGTIKITGQSGSGDNVCTAEQANIAKNKGWEVILGNTDADGNTIYDMEIAGKTVTSANYNDLTVLPGVTKNCEDGYARYEPTTQKLYLSGVDIVNDEGEGIHIDCDIMSPVIVLGQDPVNITAKEYGIFYYTYIGGNYLTITTESSDWYSEKLNITSKESNAIYAHGSLQLAGVARIVAKCPSYRDAICTTSNMDGKLYIKENAELRIKANKMTTPLATTDLVLEDDNIIVAPAGAYFSAEDHRLKNAEDKHIYGEEVVIGKLRNYNYYVAGTKITNANQHAVLGDTTVVFLEPTHPGGPGTLILNNANIEAGSEIGISAGKTLYLKLLGENNVSSMASGLASQTAYIEGPGSLNISGQYGIDAHLSKLFISDGAQITAEGSTRYAIDGKETTISGKETVVKMKCSPDARGTFRASTSLTLEDGLMIEEPAGAQYVDGEIKDADSNVIKDEWVTIQYTEDYNITVAGIAVTNHNMNDVLGDGTVSYDPETNTLTLDGANIDGGAGSGIEAEQGLHIKLEGSNTITCTTSLNGTSHGIWFKNTSYIEGPGSLNISAMYGIYAETNALKILNGAQITAEAENIGIMSGITTISGAETVVNTKGGEASFACISLTLNDGLEITQPEGASFVLSQHAICAGRRNTIVAGKWVTISKPAEVQTYDLYIAGIQVSTENQEDVLGDGTVSFDPETNTLTLMNANITPAEDTGIRSTISDLQIRLIGQNYITPTQYEACINFFGAGSKGTIVFYGGGSLELKSPSTAFLTMHDLVFTDGVKVSAESMHYWGITGQTNGGYPSITMSGEETVLMAKSGDAYYGSLVFFNSLTLNDGLTIGLPEGATFVENTGIVDAEGTQVANEWVVIASQDYIDSVSDVNANVNLNEGIYNLAGQKVENDYKGIVITGNKKYLRK